MANKPDEGRNMEKRIETKQTDSSKKESKTDQVKKDTSKKLKDNLK